MYALVEVILALLSLPFASSGDKGSQLQKAGDTVLRVSVGLFLFLGVAIWLVNALIDR